MGLGGRSPFLRHLRPSTHLPSDSSSLQETAWRLELVTPRRAVRAELPEGVPAPWRPWPLPFFFMAAGDWLRCSMFSWKEQLSQTAPCNRMQ